MLQSSAKLAPNLVPTDRCRDTRTTASVPKHRPVKSLRDQKVTIMRTLRDATSDN